jgi:predicted nucleotidyltransferase
MQISKEAISGLRFILQICRENKQRIVLIGATVPQILIDLEDGRGGRSRLTRDIDAVIEVNGWSDYDGLKQKLIEAGFKQGRAPHELHFGLKARFDLIPFGSSIVTDDQMTWTDTGRVMTTLGFVEAFRSAKPKELAPGLSALIVSIAALAILKIMAYLDRPEERSRDMVDLIYCLSEYERSGKARFELTDTEVDGRPLYFEEAGAFLLGKEVARLAEAKTKSRLELFLVRLKDEYARPIRQVLAQEKRFEEDARREDLFQLLRAFRAGFNTP